ncbi:MAG: YsnF/AvaK domain-containing protein [Pyrinomonadaceae bacterium]
MREGENEAVFDAEGVRGILESSAGGAEGDGRARVLLEDGRRLWLPSDALERRNHGTLIFRGSFEELTAAAVIPVMEEELRVGKRVVETGRVRVTKTVHEHEEVVDEPLMREEYDVERVRIDVFVDAPVGPRQEGETLIVPVLEEVLVVEKRLVVREELRITRRRTEEHKPQHVKLLSEEVEVERADARGDAAEADEGGVRSHAATRS